MFADSFLLMGSLDGRIIMNEDIRNNGKMLSGTPWRQILIFSIPILFSGLLQQCYSVVDTIIVGRFLKLEVLTGMGATWALNYIIIAFCQGTGMGIGIPIAQQFGAGNDKKLRCYFYNGLYIAAILAVVMTCFSVGFCRQFLVWMHTSETVIEYAYQYIVVIFAGIPFTILFNTCFGVLMAFGNSKFPSTVMGLSTIFNVILDFLFIIIFRMGVMGASLATVIAEALAGILCFIWLLKKYPILKVQEDEKKPNAEYMKTIVFMSFPMGLQYSVTAIGAVVLQISINKLGDIAVAGYSVGSKVKSFFLCPLNSLGSALATYVGQNYGKGDMDRVRRGVKDTIWLGIIYSCIVIVFAMLAGNQIAGLFIDSSEDSAPQVIAATTQFIRYIGVFMLLLSILFSARYAVQGMGHGDKSLFSGMAEMAARVLMSILFVPVFGFTAVCISEGVTFLAGILVIVPIAIYYLKR